MKGRLHGIGVGPGDPDLVTIKAARLLRSLPVIAWPELPGRPGFAHEIAREHIGEVSKKLPFEVPMTLERAPAQAAYDKAASEIARHLEAGRDVGVLCEGDPLFYGSFMYLLARLGTRFETEITPGVSSLSACTAAAQMPLVARSETLTVIPATCDDASLTEAMTRADAVAIPKVGRHFGRLEMLITALGLAEKARLVIHASMAGERVCRLDEAPAMPPYFSMILIRKGDDPWLA